MVEYIFEGHDAEKIIEKSAKRQKILACQANPVKWFLGRVQHKITGTNSVRELRKYYLSIELDLSFHTDYQREYDNIYAIRGWVFQKDGQSVVIRISDSKRRNVAFYLVEEERADVETAFSIETGSVCGFNIYINKKDVRIPDLKIEFETQSGYTDLNLQFEKSDDDESRNAAYFNKALTLLPTKELLREQKKTRFAYNPLISVIVPLYNTPLAYLKEMIDSVLLQSYSNVQLCLADGSSKDEVGEYIKKHYAKDRRVIYERLKHNGGISENTNAAYRMATGEFIMLCDHDDVVMLNACHEMVKALNADPEIDIVYTDEDKVTMDGVYYSGPHYKPDFNLTFLRDNNYICHIFLVRKSIVDQLEGPERKEYDGAQDFDFILRCTEKARKIYHIPKVLYHWRCHPLSTAMNPESKTYAYEAGANAVLASYQRNGIDAWVEQTKFFGRYRSHFAVQGNPKVSVILWSTGKETGREYEEYFRENTDYENLEFIPVDEMKLTDGTVLPDSTALERLNRAAGKACGDYLIFLPVDTKIEDKNWLREMLGVCSLDEVEICGAEIIDDSRWIYSCGQAVNRDGAVLDELRGWNTEYVSYTGRAESSREVSGICVHGMMIRTALFRELSGFDTGMSECASMDLCMRAGKNGKKTVANVHVKLIMDFTASFTQRKEPELFVNQLFRDKWSTFIKAGDPMYNPNF